MNTHVERQRCNQASHCKGAPPRRQRGAVVVLTAIAMLVLLGIAAMSLDGGHMILNNARLQNIVDAAALNAARVLSDESSAGASASVAAGLADVAARNILETNVDDTGYSEFDDDTFTTKTVIHFSTTLNPFVPDEASDVGDTMPRFVRVTVSDVELLEWFMQIFGLSKAVTVSAVSGPLQQRPCDLLPLVLCLREDVIAEPDYIDGVSGVGGFFFGELAVMKIAAGDDKTVGSGNFQLLSLPGGNGGKNVMLNLAGAFGSCPSEFKTKPGNTVGPVVKGLNTRFTDPTNPQLDPDLYKADNVDAEYLDGIPDPLLEHTEETVSPHISWDENALESIICDENTGVGPGNDFTEFCHGGNYSIAYAANEGWATATDPDRVGRFLRRIVTAPIADCGETKGSVVLTPEAFGEFFLIQPVIQKGDEAEIYGELIGGGLAPIPEGSTRIVLYKDPDRVDS